MPRLLVAISEVADGNLYDASNRTDTVIIENRRRWFSGFDLDQKEALRVPLSYERDDFCEYREVTAANRGLAMMDPGSFFADALITREPGVVLFLPVADCVATTIYDAKQGVLMLSHLGRHSLEQDGGYKSVRHMIDQYGSRVEDLELHLSPAPSKELYPIHALEGKGMKEALFEQLHRAGIHDGQITDSPADTATDPRYFSHSAYLQGKKPTDGRFAMLATIVY